MDCKLKIWCMICTTLMRFHLGTLLVSANSRVPCYFVFGDSLFDTGNNNNLNVETKVDYPPYGVDFDDGRPTGRFTNGKTMSDLVADRLGFDEDDIPPFARANNRDIRKGVNYASGGAGIRDETSVHWGRPICLNQQLRNHQLTMSRMANMFGSEAAAAQHLRRCMYSVGIGSNDYMNNYLLPQFYTTSKKFTPEQYATILIKQYERNLKTLYSYGARKVALFGLALIGCIPQMKALNPMVKTPCVDRINNYVKLYNKELRSLVEKLNRNLTDAKFIYVDTAAISSIEVPIIGGSITITDGHPCCKIKSNGLCEPNSTPCINRALHVFFDGFHPTEIANKVVVSRAYHSLLPDDTYPMDIKTLARL